MAILKSGGRVDVRGLGPAFPPLWEVCTSNYRDSDEVSTYQTRRRSRPALPLRHANELHHLSRNLFPHKGLRTTAAGRRRPLPSAGSGPIARFFQVETLDRVMPVFTIEGLGIWRRATEKTCPIGPCRQPARELARCRRHAHGASRQGNERTCNGTRSSVDS